jgi:hypothetical protein
MRNYIFGALFLAGAASAAPAAHPRLWWTPSLVSSVQNKVHSADPKWITLQSTLNNIGGSPNYTNWSLAGFFNAPLALPAYAAAYVATGTGGSTTNGSSNYGNLAKFVALRTMEYFCPTDFISGPWTISAITTTSGAPVQIATSTPNSFAVGQAVSFTGITGMVSLNGLPQDYTSGYRVASVTSPTSFTLNVSGDGSASSGGIVHVGGNSGYPFCFYNGNDVRTIGWAIPLVYDWTYPLWSPSEIAAFQRFVSNATVGNGSTTGHENTFQTYANADCGAAGCNTSAAQFSMVGLLGLASYGDNSTDSSGSNQQINWVFNSSTGKYFTDFKPWFVNSGPLVSGGRAHYGADGLWAEGPEYGPDEYRMAAYLGLGAATSGVFDIFMDSAGNGGNLAKEFVQALLYMTSPATTPLSCGNVPDYTLASWGDQQSAYQLDGNILKQTSRVLSYYLVQYAGDSTWGGYGAWWANTVPGASTTTGYGSCGSGYAYGLAWDLMFTEPAIDYHGNIPTDFTSKVGGTGLFRTDWNSNASWLTYRAGGPQVGQLHEDGDLGSFNLWRNGTYLTGARPLYGYICSEEDNGLMLGGLSSGTGGSAFGVAVPANLNSETFPKYLEGGSAYAAAQVDLAPNYSTVSGAWGYGTATQLLQDFIWFKGEGGSQPDFIAVLDRYKFSSAQSSRRFIHTGAKTATEAMTPDPPTVSGSALSAVNIGPNKGELFATSLGDGTFTGYVDDNAGFACWRGIDNYSIPPGYGHYYHGVLTTGTNDTHVQYFQTVEGTDAGKSKTPVEKLTGSGYVAAHWGYVPDDKVVVFSSDPSGAGISLPITYSFSAAASTETHLVANLAPSAIVNVSRSKSAGTVTVTLASSGGGTNLTASSNGILCFSNSLTPCISTSVPVTKVASCDLNSDGVVNILDVQISVNQTLGATPCTNGDLNSDGMCSIIDTQRVINAAMGQSCRIGP